MLKLTLKGLWTGRLRYALTGLAVVLGVAFMAGTMVLTDTMQKTFDGVFESANAGTDVLVRRSAAVDGDFTGARDRLDAEVVDRVAAVDGVDVARGAIQGFAQLVLADGSVAKTDGLGVTLGANWIDDDRLNPFSLATGRAPTADDEVVLDRRTADEEGWAPGDPVTVLTKAGPAPLTLVGVATYGDIDGMPGSSLVATNDATAQRLFAEPGRYDNVLVAADDGVSAGALGERLSGEVAAAGSGLEAITGAQDTADKQADLKEDLTFFNTFMLAFAYVALFVGTFIIYNTFSIVVAQRLKDLAMLRAIGARRGQVLRSVVLEAVVVGLVAAVVGLGAGIGLSFGLKALLASVGLDIPSGPVVISSGTVVTAFVVGALVSVLSAVVPAVRASRVRPIAALRDVAVDRTGASVRRMVLGALVLAGGVVAFAAGTVAEGKSALQLVGLGSLTVVLGVFTLAPTFVRPALRVLGRPVAASGVVGRYATENAVRSPRRTAATSSALMIGVALVAFITILAASTKTSLSAAVDESFRADFVVDSGSFNQGFSTSIEDDLAAVDAVSTVSPLRSAPVEVDGRSTTALAVDTATIDGLYDLEPLEGSVEDVRGDSLAVRDTTAEDEGLALGDTVRFRFADGEDVDLTVRAVYGADVAGSSDSGWLLGLDTFEQHVSDQFDRKLFVNLGDGVAAADGREAVEGALEAWPNAEVQDSAQFKEHVTAEIDQMLNLIYGLLALAVVIALIGIANTLALSIYERTRELGLLRAVGMHRRQLRNAVRWESVLVAVLGAGLGAVLAVGGAWGVVSALDDEGITRLSYPAGQLAVIVVVAGVAGVAAARGPARRAARLDILRAISTE